MIDATVRHFVPWVALWLGAAFALLALLSPFLRGHKQLRAELWKRTLVWLVIAILVVGALALGRTAWVALVGVLSVAAFGEYARRVGLWQERALFAMGNLACIATAVLVWWPYADASPGPGWYGLFSIMPAYVVIAILIVPVVRGRTEGMTQAISLGIVGYVLCGWMLQHLGYLVNLAPQGQAQGTGLVLFLVTLASLNDVAAFIVGKLAGRVKLRPAISPGKTVEGALGALVLVLAAAIALRGLVPALALHEVVLGAGIVSVGGVLGDLALAVIKRDLGIKDWSTLLPGHGGLLDRMNGLILSAPMFFHYVRYFTT
jgi:phosphatidate cytidylyltransferase